MKKNKVLIIRFSSFGDIVQCMSVPLALKSSSLNEKNDLEIHWATRSDFLNLLTLSESIDKVWGFDKKSGLLGLFKFALNLRSQNFTHVYDAHNNVRSKIIMLFLGNKKRGPTWTIRSKERWHRFLLFYCGINKFPRPFIGVQSYLAPLEKWGIKNLSFRYNKWNFSNGTKGKCDKLLGGNKRITLIPSAAWKMKRWPIAHWKDLIRLLPNYEFLVLGGKEDLFCQELADLDSKRVLNLAGKLTLVESAYAVLKSPLVISADTGLLHVADLLGTRGISLMGPSAFGFTMGKNIKTLEIDLACRPCSKDGSGKCKQEIWQRCMVEITPHRVKEEIEKILL